MLDESPTISETPQRKILLAEDDSSVRRFIEIILQRAGYDVSSAEDGLAAMQIALEKMFDAVVADAVMPNLTGFDLCRILKENPNYQNTPFIILSGHENNSEANLADAYLLKGNDIKETLLEKLSALISSKKLVTN